MLQKRRRYSKNKCHTITTESLGRRLSRMFDKSNTKDAANVAYGIDRISFSCFIYVQKHSGAKPRQLLDFHSNFPPEYLKLVGKSRPK